MLLTYLAAPPELEKLVYAICYKQAAPMELKEERCALKLKVCFRNVCHPTGSVGAICL
ncbi:MAG: hypothetical protein JWO09_417 [Bacteroidetes bacterium]|nr:hypothetical protein [Bacteroidota bacterium]